MSTRHRKNHIRYENYTNHVKNSNICQFCEFSIKDSQIKFEYKYFWVVDNIFPYQVWDTSNVLDHLMVIPKRHVDSIAHFKPSEQKEYLEVLSDYESKGYFIYARAPGSAIKSVIHQHTHLIKIDNSLKKFMLFMRRPRMLLTK